MEETGDTGNVATIQRFYEAFGRRDHRVMAASYAGGREIPGSGLSGARRAAHRHDVADAV